MSTAKQAAMITAVVLLLAGVSIHHALHLNFAGMGDWKLEPSSFLSVTMGTPLQDSLPMCDLPHGKRINDRVCIEFIEPAGASVLSNEPSNLSDVYVYEDAGVASRVTAKIFSASYDQTRSDLIEKYGEPREDGDLRTSWSGKAVRLSLYRPKVYADAVVEMELINPPASADKHVNPF